MEKPFGIPYKCEDRDVMDHAPVHWLTDRFPPIFRS